jgi:hypothetical protein
MYYITFLSIVYLGAFSSLHFLAKTCSFLFESHSDCGEMRSSIVLISIYFSAYDIEHFFIYLFVICTSLENSLFNSLTHQLIGLFVLSMFNFWSLLYILDINHLSLEELPIIFSHSVGCLFILVIISLLCRGFLK